jgi:hypothetical protein
MSKNWKGELMPLTNNCSAVTGKPTPIGDYNGPEKNCAPNPGNYWWGTVMTKYGWKHVQEVGKTKTWKAMVKLGAKK